MTPTSTSTSRSQVSDHDPGAATTAVLARLGSWTATHLREVLIGWAVVVAVFGAFAPRVESSLAGAGWQDSTSQSVAARNVIQKDFSGLGSSALEVVVVDHDRPIATDPAAQAIVTRAGAVLRSDRRVSTVVLPRRGTTLSTDGRTAVLTGGAASGPNAMVRAAGALGPRLQGLSAGRVSVELTGDSALWAQFNAANRSAMLRSEVLSWPVTIIILIVAFGSLLAAGLPLMLTMAGLLVAAGALVVATRVAPVSIWALNFALMFALALGIDYALFLVVRFRAALRLRDVAPGDRAGATAAVVETMDTAGKAVAFSAVTVLLSLSAVLLVPSPAFRSMALGIMLAVLAVLAATLTLLPAVLARVGTRIDAGTIHLRRHSTSDNRRPSGGLDRRLHGWGRLLWAHPLRAGAASLVIAGVLVIPLVGLRTSMPSISIIPDTTSASIGYGQVGRAFGIGATGPLQVVVPGARQAAAISALQGLPGLTGVLAGPTNGGYTLDQVVPSTGPSAPATAETIDRMRAVLPAGALVGGAAAENFDLQHALSVTTPLVFVLLLAIGFIVLLVALGAPLMALAGVSVTGLSVAGAFGVARLIFQNGDISGLLGFISQGFVDAWGPIFFGAMVSGVAMDYTLFLLSTAKEHYEVHRDPRAAMITSVRTSGRVVVSAAVIMIAVFLTFALSGPLAPKEMGVILAVAVALDAILVRMALLPILLRLGGHHMWARPAWLARILPDIRFAH